MHTPKCVAQPADRPSPPLSDLPICSPLPADVQQQTCSIAGVAAFVELCCGPLYILAKVRHQDNVVSFSEAAATIAKGSLTLILLKQSSLAVAIALSWAQVQSRTSLVNSPDHHAVLVSVRMLPKVHPCSSKSPLLLQQPYDGHKHMHALFGHTHMHFSAISM